MLFKIKAYIQFLLKSTNQYGVHSPIAYNFITNCLYKKANSTKINVVNKLRKLIYCNQEIITVTDFGSGSRVFKNNQRKIADIAKIAGMTKKKSAMLLNIIEYLNVENMLELGTSVGLGTATLSIGNPNAQIITLEGCKNTANVAQHIFNKFNLNNIKLVVGNFNETLDHSLKNNLFDLIYVDGNHQKVSTLQYFGQCIAYLQNDSLIIFDDINWSYEMQQAWDEIKMHPKVALTIDTFSWGIAFIRSSHVKQHFKIRC